MREYERCESRLRKTVYLNAQDVFVVTVLMAVRSAFQNSRVKP